MRSYCERRRTNVADTRSSFARAVQNNFPLRKFINSSLSASGPTTADRTQSYVMHTASPVQSTQRSYDLAGVVAKCHGLSTTSGRFGGFSYQMTVKSPKCRHQTSCLSENPAQRRLQSMHWLPVRQSPRFDKDSGPPPLIICLFSLLNPLYCWTLRLPCCWCSYIWNHFPETSP